MAKRDQRQRAPWQQHGQTPGQSRRPAPHAPDSDVPPSAPPPATGGVVPPPVAGAGGIENIPEDLLPEAQRIEDELNYAGLDVTLPGEDRAPADAAEEHTDYPGAGIESRPDDVSNDP